MVAAIDIYKLMEFNAKTNSFIAPPFKNWEDYQ